MSAGFDRDDVGTDGTHPQRRGDPGVDITCVHGAVKQQDIDQFTGPVRVAVDGGTWS
ncbi:hypothetical protein JOE31_002695 [Arthrobacter sp. PvP023]|nr:hypothetical protein [Arthrobacter sp. PvP023]